MRFSFFKFRKKESERNRLAEYIKNKEKEIKEKGYDPIRKQAEEEYEEEYVRPRERRFEENEQYTKWTREVRPVLLKLFKENPKKMDGFKYIHINPEYSPEITLKLRDDGKWVPNYQYWNRGEAYSIEDIISGKDFYLNPIAMLSQPSVYVSGDQLQFERKQIEKEVKERIGRDLSDLVEEHKSSKRKIIQVSILSVEISILLFLFNFSITGNVIGQSSLDKSEIFATFLLFFGINLFVFRNKII